MTIVDHAQWKTTFMLLPKEAYLFFSADKHLLALAPVWASSFCPQSKMTVIRDLNSEKKRA